MKIRIHAFVDVEPEKLVDANLGEDAAEIVQIIEDSIERKGTGDLLEIFNNILEVNNGRVKIDYVPLFEPGEEVPPQLRDHTKRGSTCLRNAKPDEPIFVLRGSDPLAYKLAAQWCLLAAEAQVHEKKILDAQAVALKMRSYQPKKMPD